MMATPSSASPLQPSGTHPQPPASPRAPRHYVGEPGANVSCPLLVTGRPAPSLAWTKVDGGKLCRLLRMASP